MKIITLNVWGGKMFEPLIDFIRKHAEDTDIFCFQDCLFGDKAEFSPLRKGRINLFHELESVLPDFNSVIYRDEEESFFAGEMLPADVGCGQVIFLRKNIELLESGGFRSHPNGSYYKGATLVSGRCQWIKIHLNEGDVAILSVHGLWQKGSEKKDTPERLEQSAMIRKFSDAHEGKKILCGDFNIIQDGNALGILEEGMTNLVKKYNISSTRNSFYSKDEKFADYFFVSNDVETIDFKTFPDEVSDHLALFLDWK